MKHPAILAENAPNRFVPTALDKITSYESQEKKKRLTSDQLESLEKSFQEEIKLDPDRKMKLSRELGLQPRQIAVWFQNRRARWKAKQLERLYDNLKQEFDSVSKEKQKLQEEVNCSCHVMSCHECVVFSNRNIYIDLFLFLLSTHLASPRTPYLIIRT